MLVYPPQQFRPDDNAKPEGSLGLPYLAAALERHGYAVDILDACVGTDAHSLESTFYRRETLDNGLVRIGMADDDILQALAPYDVVAITSIFTAQTSRVVGLVRLVKTAFPDKLVVVGGVNARWMTDRLFDAGTDLISVSEGEETIVGIGDVLRRGSRYFSDVPGVAFRHRGVDAAYAAALRGQPGRAGRARLALAAARALLDDCPSPRRRIRPGGGASATRR